MAGCAVLALAAYKYYNSNKDGADDRLINILKGTVDELDKKVNKQTTDIETLTKKVGELEKENETLVKVLQGRDEATILFQRQMLEMVRVAIETNGLAKQTHDSLQNLMDVIREHLEKTKK